MNILITNSALREFGGTQTVVASLCRLLRQRGHQVMIFSSHLGHVAELLIEEKFPVVSHLRDLPFPPDIIHGQHHLETMSALLALPETPAIYYIHGITPWEERVPIHPRILGYVNLGEVGAFRVTVQKCIPETRLHVMENGIDFDAIPPPKKPPERLRTAAFCPRAPATEETLKTLQEICCEHSIELHYEAGWPAGTIADPYAVYQEYDLIFGTGRTALEALAVGCAVNLTDHNKLGLCVTGENVAARRDFNFTVQLSELALTSEEISRQLREYTVSSQQAACDFVRKNADCHAAVDRLVEFYEKVIHEWKTAPRPSMADELHAASNYIRALAPLLGDHEQVTRRTQENHRLLLRLKAQKTRILWQKHARVDLQKAHRKLRKSILDLVENHEKAPVFQRVFTRKWIRLLERALRSPE